MQTLGDCREYQYGVQPYMYPVGGTSLCNCVLISLNLSRMLENIVIVDNHTQLQDSGTFVTGGYVTQLKTFRHPSISTTLMKLAAVIHSENSTKPREPSIRRAMHHELFGVFTQEYKSWWQCLSRC